MTTEIVNLYDPTREFKVLRIQDIWRGPGFEGNKVVANVGDLIVDALTSSFYNVASVDDTSLDPLLDPSYIPTLVKMESENKSGDDGFLWQPLITTRAFFDNSIIPSTVSLDDRYEAKGLDATHCKLFRGTNIGVTASPISIVFNNEGDVVSENIQLEAIDVNNPALKRPPVINVTTELLPGEVVTLVIYNQTGGAEGAHQFLVTHGSAIRRLSDSQKVLVGVSLDTDMLDSVDTNLINVPANVPLSAADFTAILHYNDGSKVNIPIDGTKCKLVGIDNLNLGIDGVDGSLLLMYLLDNGEPAINAINPLNLNINRAYKVHPYINDAAASFKIFLSPKFDEVTETYVISYWLTNAANDLLLLLDPGLVNVISLDGSPLDFSQTGGLQSLRLSVDISAVFTVGYDDFTYLQTVRIQFGKAIMGSTPWLIDYVGNSVDVYGHAVEFGYSDLNANPLSLTSGVVTTADWLLKLYRSTRPLFDVSLDLSPPTPTHFRLSYEGVTTRDILVSEWRLYQNNLNNHNWTDNDTVNVVWLLDDQVSVEKKILAMSPVMIHPSLT